MAFVTLDDGGGSQEIVVYNEKLDAARTLLREDQLVIAEVRIQPRMTDDGQVQGLRIIAENVCGLAEIRKRHARGLRINCNGSARAERLFELLAPFRPGSCPIVVEYANRGVAGEIELSDDWRVALDEALVERLTEWLRPDNVRVVY
jgi:DNA polymerase III subunit alpha